MNEYWKDKVAKASIFEKIPIEKMNIYRIQILFWKMIFVRRSKINNIIMYVWKTLTHDSSFKLIFCCLHKTNNSKSFFAEQI